MEFFLISFILLSSLAIFGMTIYAIYEIVTKPFKDKDQRVIWAIVVLALQGLGVLLYFWKRKDLLADPADEQREYLPPLPDSLREKETLGRFDEDQYV